MDTQPIVSKKKIKPEVKYGIWIGNLSYFTNKGNLKDFLKDCGEITRINMPKLNNKNKG